MLLLKSADAAIKFTAPAVKRIVVQLILWAKRSVIVLALAAACADHGQTAVIHHVDIAACSDTIDAQGRGGMVN